MVAGANNLNLPVGKLAHAKITERSPAILHRSEYACVRSLSPEYDFVGTTTEH